MKNRDAFAHYSFRHCPGLSKCGRIFFKATILNTKTHLLIQELSIACFESSWMLKRPENAFLFERIFKFVLYLIRISWIKSWL